jgi:hypothetical protein
MRKLLITTVAVMMFANAAYAQDQRSLIIDDLANAVVIKSKCSKWLINNSMMKDEMAAFDISIGTGTDDGKLFVDDMNKAMNNMKESGIDACDVARTMFGPTGLVMRNFMLPSP